MPRKRRRGTRYLDEHEIRARVGLDNQARSQSTEPHNRRKPVVGSTGTPELAEGAVTNAKISDVNASKVDAGTLADARIPNLGKSKLPGDIQYGRARSGADIDWQNKSVPDAALNKEYAPASSLDSIRQSITGINNKIQKLSKRVQNLERGKK